MRVGTGYSLESDSTRAGRLAAEEAVRKSGEPAITFLFCTDNYEPEKIFEAVKISIGKSKLVGACVPGIITSAGVFEKGVGVLTISGSEIEAVTHLEEGIAQSPYSSGEKAGLELRRSGLCSGTVFVFPDGFAANISNLLRGLYNSLGPKFVYAGGGAGDNLKFYKTYQFTEQGFGSNALAAALVKGVDFRAAAGHGWKPAGQPMMVTKADGKKVYELDGIPAFRRYSESLGGIEKKHFSYYGMKYPLGIPSRGGEFLIRDPHCVEEDESIMLVSEIPQNTVAMLMKGEVDDLTAAASRVAKQAVGSESCRAALLFDCVSRYLLLGKNFKQELAAITKNIGSGTPLMGMLSFGEISNVSGVPFFYNKSVVLVVG